MLDTQHVNELFQSDKEFFLHKNSQASCVSHIHENAALNKIKVETLKNRFQICKSAHWRLEEVMNGLLILYSTKLLVPIL